MSARVLGIDIGSHGAIALLTPTGDLIEVRDMPVLLDGPRGRPNVSAALLADIVFKMKVYLTPPTSTLCSGTALEDAL